jgi:hypothetical protein
MILRIVWNLGVNMWGISVLAAVPELPGRFVGMETA